MTFRRWHHRHWRCNGRKGDTEREWAQVEKSAPSWHILEILRHGQHSSRGQVHTRITVLSMPSCSIVHTHNFSNEKDISIQKLYPKGQRLGELGWLFQAWKDYVLWEQNPSLTLHGPMVCLTRWLQSKERAFSCEFQKVLKEQNSLSVFFFFWDIVHDRFYRF